MVHKVLYQDLTDEVPVRERTSSLYVEAESEKDVRKKLHNYNFNIEFIHPLDEAHLEFEQQSTNWQLENL